LKNKNWRWCCEYFSSASNLYLFLNEYAGGFDGNTVSHAFDGKFYTLVYFGEPITVFPEGGLYK
jgi:hypothetical protein